MEGKADVDRKISESQASYLSDLKAIYDVSYVIDSASALQCSDLSDSEKVRAYEGVALSALRTLGSSGGSLRSILNDSVYAPLFKEKCQKVVFKYDHEVATENSGSCTVQFFGDDDEDSTPRMVVYWLQGGFGYSYTSVDHIIRNILSSEIKMKKFAEEIVPAASETIQKAFGPGKAFKIEVDTRSFERATTDMDTAIRYLTEWNGYYTTQNLTRAVCSIATYEDDRIVDAISEDLKKVVFALEPGTDTEKKSYEVDAKRGKLTLKLVLEAGSSSGIFSEEELKAAVMAAGLAKRPELRIFLLESVVSSYRVRSWGYLNEVEDLLCRGDLFFKENAEERKVVDSKVKSSDPSERVLKTFDKIIKANAKGDKEKRRVVVTNKHVVSCEIKGDSIKDSNWKVFDLSWIIAIDICAVPSKVPGQSASSMVQISFSQAPEKKKGPSLPGVKLPGVKLPGIPMPSINAPSVNLPSVNLPSVNLPSVNLPSVDLPTMDLPDLGINWRRKKEPKPKRFHPATKYDSIAKYQLNVYPDGLSTAEGNALIEEIAWSVYAAYSANTHRVDYAPFYLPTKTEYPEGTTIEDKRPAA
eukprot:ANDGO_07352.mRNA.1 hypothetical protein